MKGRCCGIELNGARCAEKGTNTVSINRAGGRKMCLCDRHLRELPYHPHITGGDTGTPRKMTDIRRETVCALEVETSHCDWSGRANLFMLGLHPTYDSTARGGEYVPFYFTPKKAVKIITTAIPAMLEKDQIALRSCGMHIHMSYHHNEEREYTARYMGIIRRFYHSLFVPLSDYLTSLEDGGAEIFGRAIGGTWAECATAESDPANNKYLFVNVQHSSTIEFRQPQYITPEQYARAFRLVRRWFEMVMRWCVDYQESDPAPVKRANACAVSARMIAEYEKAVAVGLRYDIGK